MENKKEEISQKQMDEFAEGFGELMETLFKSVDIWEEERKRNEKMLEINHQHVGKIITCHLIVENLINRALENIYEKEMIDDLRLSFIQKVRMLPKKGKYYSMLTPGIEQLNQIRNKIAHNLDYQITDEKMAEIDIYLSTFQVADHKTLPVEKRIEKFTTLCITLFSTDSAEMRKHWEAYSKKYPLMFKQLKKIGQSVKDTSIKTD